MVTSTRSNESGVGQQCGEVEYCSQQIGPTNDAGDALNVDGMAGKEQCAHQRNATMAVEDIGDEFHVEKCDEKMKHEIDQMEAQRVEAMK